MSVPSACPHCQKPLPDGYIGKACPHCRGALGNKRKRSLSGFSFQAMQPSMAGSSRPPHSPHSSGPPREVVEDRWDLPDQGVEVARERGAVPPAAPTGFPAVPSPTPVASPTRASGPDPIRTTALLDPFAWNLDHAQSPAAPPARSSVLDVRTLRQTALGVGAQSVASPSAPSPAAVTPPPMAALRSTALGIAPSPAAPVASADLADHDEGFEADAFLLVRSTQPSGTTVSTRPPPSLDSADGMHEGIEIPSTPAPDFELGSHYADLEEGDERPSQMPAYSPLRAPPSIQPPPATPVAWVWSVGGAALVLSAVVALRSAPLAVALRAAAGAASLLMLARFGGLSMRALLLLLVALPALAQEALSIASLSRAGAAMLTGALVLLPAGAWISSDRALVRRALLLAGVGLTVAAILMPGGVARPWSFGALPALLLALVSMATPARPVSAALTVALMAWAAACSAIAVGATLPAVATGLAMAALVLLCGRALAAVVESDEG